MKISQKQVVSVKHTVKSSNTNKKRLTPYRVLYCIEEIRKLDNTNTVQLDIRDLTTNELFVKHPLSLYCDKKMLNLFSVNDIHTIMTYVIFNIDKELPPPLKLEGYDYSQKDKLNIYYDMRLRKFIRNSEHTT